jgi:hypothetical protein
MGAMTKKSANAIHKNTSRPFHLDLEYRKRQKIHPFLKI